MVIPSHLANISKEFRLEYCVGWCVSSVKKETEDNILYQTWNKVFPDTEFTKDFFIELFSNTSNINKILELPVGSMPLDTIPIHIAIISNNGNIKVHGINKDFNTDNNYTDLFNMFARAEPYSIITNDKSLYIEDGKLNINVMFDTTIRTLINTRLVDYTEILYSAISTKVKEETDSNYTIGTDNMDYIIDKDKCLVFKENTNTYVSIQAAILPKEVILDLDKEKALYIDMFNNYNN